MNDDELPMRAEAASAYLDGDLDAAERLTAEADPETMALVDTFTQVRSTLADVEPVDDATRSTAIAAALSQFDTLQAAAAAVAPSTAKVTTLHPRRARVYRLVTSAAAAAVIVAIGIAALKSSSGDDLSSSSATAAPGVASAEVPALKVGDTSSGAAGQTESVDAAAASATTAAAAGGAAGATLAIPAVDSPAALADYASTRAFTTAAPTAPAGTQAPPESQPAQPAQPDTQFAVPSCVAPSDEVLGPITVLGVPAFAVRDSTTGVLRAIDAVDCHVFFTAP